MASISTLVDRVKIFVNSSGTGPFVLGAAVPAFRGAEALADGFTYSYAVENGSNYEAGTGEYVASTNQILRTPTISSQGGAPVSFPAGVQIAFTALAQDLIATGGDLALRGQLAAVGGAEMVGSDDGAAGALWTTLAGFISYLRSSVGAAIVGFAQTGTGAITRTLLSKNRDVVSVKDFGAVGDGVADDTAAVQAALDSGHLAVHFPGGTYKISSPLTRTGRIVLTADGATIAETTNLSRMLTVSNGAKSNISGLNFSGVETYAAFTGGTVPTSFDFMAIELVDSSRSVISQIGGTNKRVLVRLDTCDDCLIDGFEYDGFWPAYTGVFVPGANFTTVILLSGGTRNIVTNGRFTNAGNGVVTGAPNERTMITNLSGRNLTDSGVYFSTSHRSTVADCTFFECQAAGVIARGSLHTVKNVHVSKAAVGINVTGLGTPVSDVNGFGTSVIGCTIDECSAFGITVQGVDTGTGLGYMTDITLVGNTVTNCPPTSSAQQSIYVQALENVIITGNSVSESKASSGGSSIFVTGVSGVADMIGLVLTDNIVRNSAASTGLYVFNIASGRVSGNIGNGNGLNLIEARYCGAVVFSENVCTDKPVLAMSASFANTGNIVVGNIGAVNLGTSLLASNIILPNYTTNFVMPPITSAPLATGLIGYDGGTGKLYISQGTSTTADWTLVN